MSASGQIPPAGPLQPADPDEARVVPIRREEIAMALAPRSRIAEQFRALRNSIQALNPDGAPRSIVMASAVRGEGKSVATINLALALAEVPGTHVLMIDADLHAPALEDYLGLPHRAGLSELLGGRVGMDRAIRTTSVPNVSLLAAGELPVNSTELIGSDRMRTLIGACKQRYSYILIDTPEALTISDAALLGSVSDGVLMVVRLGSTPRHVVEQTYNMLENMGGNVLGTCLTGGSVVEGKSKYAGR
ncbi:MAG: CpsD/CapB family tyrosine-protein kinase [Planctomycetes bacterium]|nr:CpsD/CapB family tyrosine-protein kinase [Planctomycetota bacterium]